MIYGYARVSTADQTCQPQVDLLTQAGCTDIRQEVGSGAKNDRPELQRLLNEMVSGDELVVYRLDRLGRSLTHLVKTMTDLNERNIQFRSLQDAGLDTKTPQGRLFFAFFAAMAEYEREIIRERVLSGMASARARGRKGGRRPGMSHKNQIKALAAKSLYESGTEIPEILNKLKISRSSLYYFLHRLDVDTTPSQSANTEKINIHVERALIAIERYASQAEKLTVLSKTNKTIVLKSVVDGKIRIDMSEGEIAHIETSAKRSNWIPVSPPKPQVAKLAELINKEMNNDEETANHAL